MEIKLGKLFVTVGMLSYFATSWGLSLVSSVLEYGQVRNLKKELANEGDFKKAYVTMLEDNINEMNVSCDEKRVLLERINPLIDKFFDKMSDADLANIVYAIRETDVERDVKLSGVNGRFVYESFWNELNGKGVIKLIPENEKGTLVHEYAHAMQSWHDSDIVYREACASLIANHGYDSLQALFMMLGDLGNKDVMCAYLLKGEGDSYFDYLKKCYPDSIDAIGKLQKVFKKWFKVYKENDCENSNENNLILKNEVMDSIYELYSNKYDGKISDDYLFNYFKNVFLGDDEQWELLPYYNYFTNDEFMFIDNSDNGKVVIDNNNRFKVRGKKK